MSRILIGTDMAPARQPLGKPAPERPAPSGGRVISIVSRTEPPQPGITLREAFGDDDKDDLALGVVVAARGFARLAGWHLDPNLGKRFVMQVLDESIASARGR